DSYPITTANGQELTLMGIDPTAMLPLNTGLKITEATTLALMYPPYPVMVSADLAKRQKWRQGQKVTLDNGTVIGPMMIDHQGQVKGTHAIADLSVVRGLKHDSGLGVIACGTMTAAELQALKQYLPDNLVVVRTAKPELQRLTDAFHLNLTAMGMLSFLVGLFIFYQAMSLSMIQRQPLVGLLRQAGASHRQLAQAITIELIGLILVSWLCGNVFGLMLANQLIPSVSQSLRDLYDANVGLSVHWDWSWSLYTLMMATAGAFLSCAWPLVRLLTSPPIRLTAKLSLIRFAGREFALQAILAFILIIAAFVLNYLPKTQMQSFVLIGLILLSAALLTPYIIWKTFDILSFRLPWVKVRWFFADAAASMSFRGIATMAFIIAMAANIGVETIVGSFRITTDKWLDERLAADLYLYPSSDKASVVSHWLEKQPEVSAVWWRWEKDVSSNQGTLQMVSTGNSLHERDALTVKSAVPHYWYFLHTSRSVMISETLASKHHLRPGEFIDLPGQMGKHWLIAGVYYDYGNPYGQIMMSQYHWLSAFVGEGRVGLAVLTRDRQHDVAPLKSRLNTHFLFDVERVHSNSYLHTQAMKVFDRTFL
ncbi:MAG: ABC transporter permease, partial [Vibrio sp.]